MKKVMLLLLVPAFFLSVYYLLAEKTNPISATGNEPVIRETVDHKENKVKEETKEETKEQQSKPVEQPHIESGWDIATLIDHKSAPRIRPDVQNARLIKPNTDLLLRLQKGDYLSITIPQSNQSYTIAINQIKRTASGSRVITGKVINTIHSVVFTVGPKSLFGTISTPDAIYNLSGRTDLAWLIAARELNYHVDLNIPDYIIPKHNFTNDDTSVDSITNDQIMAKNSLVKSP